MVGQFLNWRYASAFVLTATAYATTAVLGLNWSVFPGAGTAIWPAAGVAFAALVIGGLRLWPALIAGRLATAFIVGSPMPFWVDLLVALGTTSAAVIPAALVERKGGLDRNLASMRDIAWLCIGGALGGGVISASLGVVALLLGGVPIARAGAIWINWWTGFVVGTLVFAPLILSWWQRSAWRMPKRAWGHFFACMAAVAMVSYVTFLGSELFPAWYVYPVLAWAALAFQVRGAAVGLLIASMFAIVSAIRAEGILTALADTATGRVLLAQQFIAVTALTVLFLAAVADERRGTARLRESERRFRIMADSSPAIIWVTDENGNLVFANRRYEEVFQRTASELTEEGWLSFIHPDDREAYAAAFQAASATRQPFEYDARIIDHAGEVRWFRCVGVPRFARGHFVGYSGVDIDVTAAKRGEEHRKLLVNELNHRVKNTLAIVQGIAQQTFKDERVPRELRTAFEGRLATLAAAHNVLTRENWESAPLRRIIDDAIHPFGMARFVLSGPDLRVAPKPAVSLALALHELATNAAKYGALSVEGGYVDLRWTTSPDTPLGFELHWREYRGPAVLPPVHRGFGSRLIERGLAAELDGKVTIEYRPDGLCCDIRAPLGRLAA